MRKNTLFNTTFLTSLATFSHFAFAAPTVVPNAPELSSRGYVLMDYHTGKVLVERDADKRLNPASLTKLMTAYVAGQEVNAGNISLDDQVVISRNAWAKNFPDSSKMFIEVNTSVSLSDLYRGLVVQSGNDASVAIAEHVAGSEAGFVSLMNSWASQLGLTNSSFTNPHGLDSDGLYSTPHDIAKLGQAIIRDLPDIYPMYSETSFTYNGITQYNRNGLLRDRSMNVDGMKTGYTSGAGYSLATSATNGDMRLIAVVMGRRAKVCVNQKVSNFLVTVFDSTIPWCQRPQELISQTLALDGAKDELKVGVNRDVYLTLPKSDVNKLKAEVEYSGDLLAPIAQDQVVGKVLYKVDGKVVKETELVALEPVEEGGIFKRIMDWFKQLVASWF